MSILNQPHVHQAQSESPVLLRLIAEHGELMGSEPLMKIFKFTCARSFRRAATNGALPVNVFRMTGRWGWFARTRDVATWLVKVEKPLTC